MGIERDYLSLVCRKLEISELSDSDFRFLEEFLKCLEPIAETITVLEGDILYGHTLPALFTIQTNFRELRSENLEYTLPLVHALEDGFEERYMTFLNPSNAAAAPYFLAMVSHPSYKLDCVPADRDKIKKIFNLLLREAQALHKKEKEKEKENEQSASSTGIDEQGTQFNDYNS